MKTGSLMTSVGFFCAPHDISQSRWYYEVVAILSPKTLIVLRTKNQNKLHTNQN